MLLTSSQVSLLVTGTVISLSTFFLFLAGVYLQHDTVTRIRKNMIEPQNARLNPPKQNPLQSPNANSQENEYIKSRVFPARDPGRAVAAHVQIVQDESLLCNSLMILSSLWSGSKGRINVERVLFFPSSWNTTASSRTIKPTTRRLLQAAENRFDIHLQPVSDLPDLKVSKEATSFLRRKLSGYTSALYLPNLLTIVDPRPYDTLLSAGPPSKGHPFSLDPLILVAPDPEGSERTTESNTEIVIEKEEVEEEDAEDKALSSTYHQILDNAPLASLKLPRKGPQYDVPIPSSNEKGERWDDEMQEFVRTVWTMFRDKREEVCGLDLEPWLS